MRILIYGAGNIGSLYAGRLQEHADVSIVARGARAAALRSEGIVLEEARSRKRTAVHVPVLESISEADAFDWVIVCLPKHRLEAVLPVLAQHQQSPNVLFFGNNAAGPGALVEALGAQRVLLGFPGAAGVADKGVLRYLVTSRGEQPTTFGELDEEKSERVDALLALFEAAGFPSAHCPQMDAWLKTHVAKVLPTAWAVMASGGDAEKMVADAQRMKILVRAIREGFRVLRLSGVPIVPANHRVFEWLPERLLCFALGKMLGGGSASLKVAHALEGRAEWVRIAEEFQPMIDSAGAAMPHWDSLRSVASKAVSAPDGVESTLSTGVSGAATAPAS